jgi:hypothetical protein
MTSTLQLYKYNSSIKKSLINTDLFTNTYKNNIVIILTTTVYHHNVATLAQTDPIDRINIYIKSFSNWLKNTSFNIVVVENSGYSFPDLKEYIDMDKYKDRFEIISFNELEIDETIFLDNLESKGKHELYALKYACSNSNLIKNTQPDFIIKITGRYFISSLENFLSGYNIKNYTGLRQYNSDNCEIVGFDYNNFIKYVNINKDNVDNIEDHVEDYYKRIIESMSIERVIVCPKFMIEPTRNGGGNEFRNELFTNGIVTTTPTFTILT